jgi:DNA-binding response OmpR family regulator
MDVDDDATLADVVARYLAHDGHRVECVHDGCEAFRRITVEPPGLVVLDLMLPGMDGLEACAGCGSNGRSRW